MKVPVPQLYTHDSKLLCKQTINSIKKGKLFTQNESMPGMYQHQLLFRENLFCSQLIVSCSYCTLKLGKVKFHKAFDKAKCKHSGSLFAPV